MNAERSANLSFLALGDSYTIGEGVAREERWPEQLAVLARAQDVPLGDPLIIARTGWTTDELSAAIDSANPQGPFALVTLLIGVNNQYRGRDADEYRGQFRALLARAVGFAGGDARHVVVLSIPDWGVTPFAEGRDRRGISAAIESYNAIGREETARAGGRFVDVTAASKRAELDRSLLAADGLHPSGKMYSEWARLALIEIVAALGTPGRSGFP
ncbi:MAG: SGNH/GDSL hydrolase family protein [Anaerolineae bacterium]|nr:SGNH/GDSL hydrolase family protein [Gemmatimonadaceae bacterium]